MKKKIALLVAALFVVMIALIPLLRDQTWACGVVMSRQGRGTPYQDGQSIHFGPISGEDKTYGVLADSRGLRHSSEATVPGFYPMIETVNFYGNKEYKFRYSGDVTRFILWSGDRKVYDGLPIDSYRVDKKQELGVHFEWSGNEASIEITDRCSLGSVWSGLF